MIFGLFPQREATPRRLTFDDAEADSPTWTPDGKSVIFLLEARGKPHALERSGRRGRTHACHDGRR